MSLKDLLKQNLKIGNFYIKETTMYKFSQYLENGGLLNEETEKSRLKKVLKLLGIDNKDVEKILNETKSSKSEKREALKNLGLKPSQINKLLNESDDTTYICPQCHKPTVTSGSLGWRDCSNCGWEEKLPSDLEKAGDEDIDESVNSDEITKILGEGKKSKAEKRKALKNLGLKEKQINKLLNEELINECIVTINGAEYNVKIMDCTHINMKPVDAESWGIPQHIGQVRDEVIEQLKAQGKIKNGCFVTGDEKEPMPIEELHEENESKPTKWRVWSLDVLGNESDGWEVNNKFEEKIIDLKDTSDETVVQALKDNGYLNNAITKDDLEFGGDDRIITVDDSKTGEFLYELTSEEEV
jgi:hypothetical protein